MKREDFNFDLPPTLIAQYPLPNRSDSRLLFYDRATKTHQHSHFKRLVDFLESDDLLVMNDSKVIPARLYGHKESGGKIEFLIERITGEQTFIAHIKASKAPKAGSVIHLCDEWQVQILEKRGDVYDCRANITIDVLLETLGHMPLPPYITRTDSAFDLERYQTIYAKHKGSVAAPTAGLHMDEAVLTALTEKGVKLGYLTLHVGVGTFRPVRTETIFEHKMHAESFSVSEALCEAVAHTRALKKRVIAVGTTTLRSLESAARDGVLRSVCGETSIFIYPGYPFQICDGLITNFHLPESTLLMLVSAFIGHQETMALYQMAIAHQYRFFSYGDACLFL